MMCSMCGKETKLFIAQVEGTEMKICGDCAKFGKILKEVYIEPIYKKKQVNKHKQVQNIEEEKEIIKMVVQDYSKIIRNKRDQLGLKQKDFAKLLKEKESRIQNIETGKFTPSLVLAKKLEQILKIKLIEEYEETKLNKPDKESKSFTLGDMINIKK